MIVKLPINSQPQEIRYLLKVLFDNLEQDFTIVIGDKGIISCHLNELEAMVDDADWQIMYGRIIIQLANFGETPVIKEPYPILKLQTVDDKTISRLANYLNPYAR